MKDFQPNHSLLVYKKTFDQNINRTHAISNILTSICNIGKQSSPFIDQFYAGLNTVMNLIASKVTNDLWVFLEMCPLDRLSLLHKHWRDIQTLQDGAKYDNRVKKIHRPGT